MLLLANELPGLKMPLQVLDDCRSHHLSAQSSRILVADDQADVREALRLLLKVDGYETELVSGPASLMGCLEHQEFDLVLLDLNYTRDTTSGREGLDLLSRIRALDPSLPVVVMTAWSNVDLAVEAMRLGACDFVQKPWDNKQVLASIRHHLQRHRTLRRDQSYMNQELNDAIATQRRFLPEQIPQPDGCQIASSYEPARHIGGDYFDVVQANGRTALCIADVEGKGLPAALLMANLQASLKPQMQQALRPAETCRGLNAQVRRSGKFISLFYGVLDRRGQRLTYCNAGHLPPLLVHSDGSCERLLSDGAVLGAFDRWSDQEREVCLEPGSCLVLYTDGIVEAHDNNGDDFGEPRLIDLIVANRHRGADDLKRIILAEVMCHSGELLQDDATLIVVTINS